ncbi:MAG: hypothetical protein C5S47_03355 [Candidatus Methanogasteraceae archaeon]|nr:MAG: hypothetical protein C5S47_03355 [ANME-2 cluster archaeon]
MPCRDTLHSNRTNTDSTEFIHKLPEHVWYVDNLAKLESFYIS